MAVAYAMPPPPAFGAGAGVRPGAPLRVGGTRTWLTEPDLTLDWLVGTKPREVMIPPGKCVYFMFGCQYVIYRRNYCRKHYREIRDSGELIPHQSAPRPRCRKCDRRAVQRSELCTRCRKQAWRELNRKHVRQYENDYNARKKQREREEAEHAQRSLRPEQGQAAQAQERGDGAAAASQQ